MSAIMSVKQMLQCSVNMPHRLQSDFDAEGKEKAQGLPPYAHANVFPTDEFTGCPENWEHGSDVVSSYFMGVEEDKGLWLDFNECHNHTHDVAIVISVQGVNPITGQTLVGKKKLKLQQFHKKCPIHRINFQQDRYCPKCEFKWPGQNYLSTTGTPRGSLWLDGFRGEDGSVRQYIFTAEEMRGIATQIIGKKRVFAIGIAFYLSNDKKPVQKTVFRDGNKISSPLPTNWDTLLYKDSGFKGSWSGTKYSGTASKSLMSQSMSFGNNELGCSIQARYCSAALGSAGCDNLGSASASADMALGSITLEPNRNKIDTPVKNFEVGAGALINQRVYDDPKVMDYWEKKPSGMILLNYCDQGKLKEIINAGRRADEKEGFMKGLQVGG